MVPGQDPMGAPTSFTSRRPNASHLPSFELPPPSSVGLPQKYPSSYPTIQPAPTATTLTSVGNLLTPPSNSSDGISPGSSAITTGSSISSQGGPVPQFPAMFQHPTASYGFHPSQAPHYHSSERPLFSPSLNSIVRGNNSPSASQGLPPPPFEIPAYHAPVSMPAPSLPTLQHQQHMVGSGMMGGQPPVSAPGSHPSPVHAQESFSRPPPTPTYYNNNSQPSSTPQQSHFPYSTGPSPIQQSPISAGGSLTRMSPVSAQTHIPSLQHPPPPQYQPQRQYSYPLHGGPVLSNVSNPSGQLALVGGMPHGMVGGGFNSGTAAMMHQHYSQHPAQQNAQNERPFRCDQCPQSFNRNHDLKRHKRIHLAVKPFPCGWCDKSFSRKDALKRHVLVKGCGKALAATEIKELDCSLSPKSESVDTTPLTVPATA